MIFFYIYIIRIKVRAYVFKIFIEVPFLLNYISTRKRKNKQTLRKFRLCDARISTHETICKSKKLLFQLVKYHAN